MKEKIIDISITIGLLEAEIDSLKDAYKNCKFSALKREYSVQLISHKQALKMLKQAADLEPLINQEVEKRIAERMPSDELIEEIQEKSLIEYDNAPICEIDYYSGFEDGCKWLRSRLTCSEKPNNSQKTEGGEG